MAAAGLLTPSLTAPASASVFSVAAPFIQTAVPEDDPVLRGTLRVAGVPADTGTVVLHRVTPEAAGPIDSVRVGPGGTFAIALPEPPGSLLSGTFFATYRHDGVVFFGGPITGPERLEQPYDIRAFPSRSLDGSIEPSFRVTFRNVFVEEGPEGWRVTDVFEVGHADEVTWTSPDPAAGAPVWAHPLPAEARNVQAAESDMSAGSLRLDRGALEVHAPFPPGDRLFVIRYDLPSLETTFPLVGMNGAVEFLVREPAPAMRVQGLQADAPVELERGSLYRRWWGEEVSDMALRIRLGEEPAPPTAWLAIGLAALLIVGGSVFVFRRRGDADGTPQKGRRAAGSAATAIGASAVTRAGDATGTGSSPGPPLGMTPAERRRILLEIAHLEEAVAHGSVDPAEADRRKEALLADLASR